MSWHCSVGAAADFSLPNYLAGLRSRRSKSTPTAARSSSNASETASLIGSLYGTTFGLSTASPGRGFWTSSQAVFRARTFRSPGKGRVFEPGPVLAYGRSLLASLAKAGLVLRLSKTPLSWSLAAWTSSSETLPSWGMTHAGACWELGISAAPIDGTACSYWPTPKATDADRGGRGDLLQAVRGNQNKHFKPPEIFWPTPTAQGGRSARQHVLYIKLVDQRKTTVQQVEEMSGGSLFPPSHVKLEPATFNRPDLQPDSGKRRKGYGMNPAWTESLMGFPIGWTALEPLGMRRFLKWRQRHSSCLPTA